RLFESDCSRLVLRHQLLHALEDRLQAQLQALVRRGLQAPVVECPEAAFAFVDDGVPARGSAWIDAQNSHDVRLGAGSDVPPHGETACFPVDPFPNPLAPQKPLRAAPAQVGRRGGAQTATASRTRSGMS